MSFLKKCTFLISALLLVVWTSAFAAEFDVQITSDKEVYSVNETALFTVTVYRNGDLLTGESAIVEATFPDQEHPVALNSVSQGVFWYESELTSAGEMTLTAIVRHDFSGAIEAMEAKIIRLEEEITELEAQLAGEIDPKKQRVLEARIDNRLAMIDKFAEKIANFEEPEALGMNTIMVDEQPLPGDTTPPVFVSRIPAQQNFYAWTADPTQPVGAKVTDTDSGVAMVRVYVDGSDDPVEMIYDDDDGYYKTSPTAPWTEGMHTFRIVALDNAGNSATLMFYFISDYTAPAFTSFYPDKETTDTTPRIQVGVSDLGLNIQSVCFRIDASPCNDFFFDPDLNLIEYQVTTPLVLDEHYVWVSASDYAGNTTKQTFIFRIVGP
jgi:hypothetical protein